MKLIRTLSLTLALATSVSPAFADDAKKPAPAAPAATPPKADVDKFLAFFDALVDKIVANKDSCPNMATAVNAHIDANMDMIKKSAEEKAKGMTLPKDAQDHMMGSIKKMMGAMQKCGNDPEVQKAFQRMDLGKKK
jgi:hypothetical protein